MTTIAIVPEAAGTGNTCFRAIAGTKDAVGKTPGEALDAIASQLEETESGTLIVVQNLRPDRFFDAEQQKRLQELMERWRQAKGSGVPLPSAEQEELEQLIEAEVRAATARAAALVRGLQS